MICQWCKQNKDEIEFHWKWKNVERLKVCKSCRKDQSKIYRNKTKEKRYSYNKEYTRKYKVEIAEYMKLYHIKHIDDVIKKRKERADKISEYNSKYYRDHREKLKECKRIWVGTNRDRNNYYSKKHQASKRGAAIVDFTIEQWHELLNEFNNLCAYCGSDKKQLQEDHIQPVSKNGNHTKSNIVPACINCNSSKKDKTLEQWKKTLYFIENCSNSRI
jgi:hypothetical protein